VLVRVVEFDHVVDPTLGLDHPTSDLDHPIDVLELDRFVQAHRRRRHLHVDGSHRIGGREQRSGRHHRDHGGLEEHCVDPVHAGRVSGVAAGELDRCRVAHQRRAQG
jgi:hypothetical protein